MAKMEKVKLKLSVALESVKDMATLSDLNKS